MAFPFHPCKEVLIRGISLTIKSESWSQLNFDEFETSLNTLLEYSVIFIWCLSCTYDYLMCPWNGEWHYIVMIKIYLCFPIC